MGSPVRYRDEDLARFEQFWRDERAAARLYRGLGSVSLQCVTHATCPVTVVRPPAG